MRPPRCATAIGHRHAALCTPRSTGPSSSTRFGRSLTRSPGSVHSWWTRSAMSTITTRSPTAPSSATVVPAGPQAVRLSAREREVLEQLPSLRNLEEIADHLAVSVNTVKSHVRAIYGKLGVSSRRTAVLAAHEHGLLV